MNSNERPSVPPSSMRLSPSRRVLIACCALAGAVLASLALIALLPGRAPPPPYAYPGCTPEQIEVFQLLDRFFPPDLPEHPFVEVVTALRPGFVHRPRRRHAFLLEDRDGRLRVRYLAGEVVAPQDGWFWRVTTVPVDLAAHADDLAAMAARGAEGSPDFDEPMRASTRALVAARALARAGRMADIDRVWQRLPERLRGRDRLLADDKFREDLVNRVALEVGDASVSWEELLARHEDLLACAPDEWVKKDREAMAAVVGAGLGSGVRDDLREAARPRGWNWSTMHLPRWEPAVPDGFDRVLSRGLDVVPDLLRLLDDKSPTRSVGYATRKGFRIGQAGVGDIAEEALGALFARPARIPDFDWSRLYDHVRLVGHRAYLAARMRSDADGYDAAASYLRSWPDAVGAVLDAASDVDVARRFALLNAIPDADARAPAVQPRFVELLRSVAIEGGARHRADATWQLLFAGDPFGAQLLRRRWLEGWALDEHSCGVLLASGLPGIWDEFLSQLDAPALRATFAALVEATMLDDLLGHVPAADRDATAAVVRRCLLRLLEDSSPAALELPKIPDRTFDDPNLRAFRATHADFAAIALAAWWPSEFEYDVRGTTTMRRRQIDAMLSAHGLQVPPAPPRHPGRTPNEIGPIEFGAGAEAIVEDLKQRLRVIEHVVFDARRICATLETVGPLCSAKILLHFERTGDGDGWSVICETRDARGGGGVLLYESVGGTFRAQYADERYDMPPAGAAEITFVAH